MGEKSDWDRGFDAGYDRGFTAGKEEAYQKNGQKYNVIFDRGFRDGWNYRDFEKEECKEIHTGKIPNRQLAEIIREALIKRDPLSVIVLGDGEALTLAQDLILTEEEIRWRGPFLAYAGVEIPDLIARDRLANAIRLADYVGPTNSFGANFQPLLLKAFRKHGIDFRKLQICSPFFNYELFASGALQDIILNTNPKPNVLLIGNRALELRRALAPTGLNLVEPVSPVNGVRDVERVMTEVTKGGFDLALVSAGVATSIICVQIAEQLGKVALKFGHLADWLIRGNAKW